MPLGYFRTRPQRLDLQFRSQILSATYMSSVFSMIRSLIEAARTTDQLKNKTGRSMNGHSERNKMAAHVIRAIAPTG